MAVSKRSLILVIALLICSLILGGCKQSNPEISVKVTLSNITEEEFKQINDSSKPEGATIDDLKKLYVDVILTDSKSATERIITIPDLFIIDRYDRARTTNGGRSELNNIGMAASGSGGVQHRITEGFRNYSMMHVVCDAAGLLRTLYDISCRNTRRPWRDFDENFISCM